MTRVLVPRLREVSGHDNRRSRRTRRLSGRLANSNRFTAIFGYLVVIFPCCTAATGWVQGAEPFSIDLRKSIDPGDGPLNGAAFSPDGTVIAVGGTRFAHVFDGKTGERLHRLEGHTEKVTDVAFSPDGKLLASASADKTIRLWDVKSGKLVKILKGDGSRFLADTPVRQVRFLLDGKMLASCGMDEYVTLWDIETGLWELKARTSHGRGSANLAVSRDGKRCAVVGNAKRNEFAGQVSCYQVRDGLQPLWNRDHEGDLPATHVAFSPDGSRLLSCSQDNTIRIWDVKTGEVLKTFTGPDAKHPVVAALFLPDGIHVVSVTRNETLQLWDAGGEKVLATAGGKALGIKGVAHSPDGRTVATVGEEKLIKLWDIRGAGSASAPIPKREEEDKP